MAVIAVISAVAIPAYNGYVQTSYRTDCENEVSAIRLAQEEFFLENNQYFDGTNAANLETNSSSIYKRSDKVLAGDSNCTYAVVTTGTPPSSYTLTATGANNLLGYGTVVTFSK